LHHTKIARPPSGAAINGGFMKIIRLTATVAAVVLCGATEAVIAKDRTAPAGGLRAVQIDCMKQYGAYEDPTTKRLMINGTLTDMQSKTDAIYACVAQKSGKPAAHFMSETLQWR
jgi:hypothetical protein